MPKQIYKIDNFHGGLNTNADPRDIADNEFPSATDVMVDELGTIRTLGGTTAHPSETGAGSVSHANAITPGYGLFAWKADRKLSHVAILDYHGTHTGSANQDGTASNPMVDSSGTFPFDALIGATINNTTDGSSGVITDNNLTTVTCSGGLSGGTDNDWDNTDAYTITDIPTTGESYLAFSDSDNTGTVKLYAMGSDSWGAPIANRNDVSGGNRKDVFYAVDGALRVCDAIFENDNTSRFHGYTDTTFLSSLSGSEVVRDYWTTQSQYITKPSSNSSFDQAITSTGAAPDAVEARTAAEVDSALTSSATITSDGGSHYYFESDAIWAAASVVNIYKLTVEVQIVAGESEKADYSYTLTAGDATNSTTFAGSLGTNYQTTDNAGTVFIDGGATAIETHVFTFNQANTPLDSGGTTAGVRVLLDNVVLGDDIASIAIHTVTVQESTGVVSTTKKGVDGTAISNGEIFGEFAFSEPGAGKAIGWDRKWEHGFTFIYDGIQESLVTRVKDITTTSTDTDGSTLAYSYEQAVTDPVYSPDTRISIKYEDTWNPRVTGAVWYVRDVSGDVPSQWWAQVEYDLLTAKAKVLASGKEFTALKNLGTNEIMFDVDQEYLLQPNQADRYITRNGFSEDNESITAKFKTAVQVGRRIYIGNVQILKEDGTKEVKGDAMLKSPVNRFDTFPSSSLIEAAVNDGESITALQEFADRILQFKEQTLYIINVSQDIEFLEDVYKYKGVLHTAATCKTDYGIAWVNRLGCYLYDGKQVINLLEKGGRQIIKESDWLSFTTDSSIIGYVPKKRQLIVLKDCSGTSVGDIFLYDMVTQSWVQGDSVDSDSVAYTNFVNDSNGDLVWAHTSDTGTMRVWSDASITTSQISFKTKDLDFGQPGQRKKIYKAYVSYKGDGGAITVNYGTDGNSTMAGQFYITGSTGASTKANAADLCIYDADVGTNDWVLAELIPSSSINNIDSFRLKFDGGTTDANFEINDISVIYRMKNIK